GQFRPQMRRQVPDIQTGRCKYAKGRLSLCASSLLSIRKEPRKLLVLLAEYENAVFPRKTDFLHLAVLSDEHGIIRRLCRTVFPAPFGFGQHLVSFLNRGFVAVDQQAVLACLQISFAD
ncbi:MAG: hypothetical protein WBP75_02940, partial [Candidatus Cybelea sp.]